jgi:hypothetical protein
MGLGVSANGTRYGPLLIERIAAHHQSTDRTAAEAEHGKL